MPFSSDGSLNLRCLDANTFVSIIDEVIIQTERLQALEMCVCRSEGVGSRGVEVGYQRNSLKFAQI